MALSFLYRAADCVIVRLVSFEQTDWGSEWAIAIESNLRTRSRRITVPARFGQLYRPTGTGDRTAVRVRHGVTMCHQHSCWRRAVARSVCLAALTDPPGKAAASRCGCCHPMRLYRAARAMWAATMGGVPVQAAARAWSYRAIDR
jgi:hypothetical protein